jgi:hypothetical protein
VSSGGKPAFDEGAARAVSIQLRGLPRVTSLSAKPSRFDEAAFGVVYGKLLIIALCVYIAVQVS